jgi:hypothetical protein
MVRKKERKDLMNIEINKLILIHWNTRSRNMVGQKNSLLSIIREEL